jgi:hypothetical protein
MACLSSSSSAHPATLSACLITFISSCFFILSSLSPASLLISAPSPAGLSSSLLELPPPTLPPARHLRPRLSSFTRCGISLRFLFLHGLSNSTYSVFHQLYASFLWTLHNLWTQGTPEWAITLDNFYHRPSCTPSQMAKGCLRPISYFLSLRASNSCSY